MCDQVGKKDCGNKAARHCKRKCTVLCVSTYSTPQDCISPFEEAENKRSPQGKKPGRPPTKKEDHVSPAPHANKAEQQRRGLIPARDTNSQKDEEAKDRDREPE